MLEPADVAVRFTLVVVQVSTAGCVTVRLGLEPSCVTVTLSFCVQPLAAVAVTMYLPGVVTLTGFWPAAKPVQVIVVPLLAAVKLTDVVAHVNIAGGVTVSVGLVTFCVTVTLSFCVQPLAAVAVTIYLPGVLTLTGF